MRFALALLVPLGSCLSPSDRSHGEDARIAIVSGNQQGAPVRESLPQPLTVGVFDDRGRPVSDARVVWSTVHGDGLLGDDTTTTSDSGLSRVTFTVSSAPGIDSVRAGLVGSADAVTFNLFAGGDHAVWPHEPAGFTALTDWAYNMLVTNADGSYSGGANVWNQTPGSGLAVVLADPSAPLSPPNVLEFVYPVGLRSGLAPWTLYFNPKPRGREFYTAFWWKANAGWQGDPSGINKIIFWQDAAPSSANLILMMNNQRQHDFVLTATVEFNQATNGHLPNVAGEGRVWHLFGNVGGGNYVITPGTWYRIELYFKGSTTPTSQDGVIRWWATKLGDTGSTEVGNYTDVNFDAQDFIQFSFAPTWGGNSGVGKLHQDFYRIDHVRVSRP